MYKKYVQYGCGLTAPKEWLNFNVIVNCAAYTAVDKAATEPELAETILKLTASRSGIVYLPLPQDDPRQRRPDISLAKEKLNGWEPKVQLEAGLKKTIAYFEKTV